MASIDYRDYYYSDLYPSSRREEQQTLLFEAEGLKRLGGTLRIQEEVISKLNHAGDTSRLLRFGNEILENGHLNTAIEAFEASGADEELRDLGENCLGEGSLDNLEAAYKIYKFLGDAEKLIEVGNAFLQILHSNLEERSERTARYAYEAYEAAGKKMPDAELVFIGDVFLQSDFSEDLEDVLKIYKAANANEKLMELAEVCLRIGNAEDITIAYEAYEAAGKKMPRDRIIEYGDKVLHNNPREALEAYKLAGDQRRLLNLGKRCFINGDIDEGLDAYQAAGKDPPKKLLVLCGDRAMVFQFFDSARRSYTAAGNIQKLVKLGNRCLEKDMPDDARRAYAAAVKLGARVPTLPN